MDARARGPYRRYSAWLRDRYGTEVRRIAIDAGFTCPGRLAGVPCAYCDDAGSRAPYLGDLVALDDQIDAALDHLRSRDGAIQYLLYLEAYTNTFAPVATLRRVYDEAIASAQARVAVAGIVVGTRPDCIDEQKAWLLAGYRDRGLDVLVELGLESAHDATLTRICRGHDVAAFDRAVELLHGYGVEVAAHLILGLPGEGVPEVITTARHLSALPIAAVKLHNLVLVEGTALYDQWQRGATDVRPVGLEQYVELLTHTLEHLRDDIVVMRLTCESPHGVRHQPERLPDKQAVAALLADEFAKRGTRQGIYWRQDADEG